MKKVIGQGACGRPLSVTGQSHNGQYSPLFELSNSLLAISLNYQLNNAEHESNRDRVIEWFNEQDILWILLKAMCQGLVSSVAL